MTWALIFSGFCCVAGMGGAQTSPGTGWSAIDSHALAAPASVQGSFKSLAGWLTAPCRSDEEKARALYRWITQNIEYDVNALLSGGPMSGNAEDALRTRRGVCEGYAGLFMELAKAAGLKAARISGFAKGYGYAAGQPLGKVPNHSWNAVSINGRWKLMDCTWGAGFIGDDRKFHRAFDNHFFFTPPQEFIFDHLPEQEEWQLLDHPLSRGEYERAVHVKPVFFNLGLTLGENTEGTMTARGEIVIRLGASRPVAGIAAIFKGVKSIDDRYAFVQNESNALVVRVTPPDTGTHTLRLFARSPGDTGTYVWILDYRIVSSGKPAEAPAYPRKYAAFDDGRVRLIEPISGLLDGGSEQTFRLIIPGAEKAALVVYENWTFLKPDGEELRGDVTVQHGSIAVCAKYPGREQWDTLLEYKGK
jgi:hypothetical protein